ncbi:uncharacterized protein FOMMEDRAFT_161225 [Fomitiporia mediterranea MF3/22]|uniref:uncharacterized protein n=1 Tax=Fomitiporia mediterranea (strain MF3/22) TaxID=694068 RepID=UPI000440982F|nr:uncharacterized protein FOMMEDRAFT_161225 [Fomitiporia mediterranea MF3/22]EJC99015.1 hypothetical protein FOMMEDRAFT_161225 [Fomitiporia mediterranea MF3/22]
MSSKDKSDDSVAHSKGTGADGSIRETAPRISISTDNLSADEIPTDTAVSAYPQKTAGNLRD